MKTILSYFTVLALAMVPLFAASTQTRDEGNGLTIATTPTQNVSFHGAAPVPQRANANQGYAGAAIGTLTFSGNPAAADTATVGATTYTFQASLTGTVANQVLIGTTADVSLANLVGSVNFSSTSPQRSGATYNLVTATNASAFASPGATVAAGGTLTSSGTNVSNADTVTVGTKVYTFETSLSGTIDGQVHIGGSADASLLNLINAINHTGTPGTDYVCAAVNPFVSAATSVTSHAFAITALTAGASGNTIATTETASTLSFGGATLSGGSSTIVFTAKAAGTTGNSVATTEASSALSFGGSTLASGTAAASTTQLTTLVNEMRDSLVQKGLIKGAP